MQLFYRTNSATLSITGSQSDRAYQTINPKYNLKDYFGSYESETKATKLFIMAACSKNFIYELSVQQIGLNGHYSTHIA